MNHNRNQTAPPTRDDEHNDSGDDYDVNDDEDDDKDSNDNW